MYFRKLKFIVLLCTIFLATNIVILGETVNQGNKITTPPEVVDKFLELLMDTESISQPDYEHFDISPDGRWVAFALERGFREDDTYNASGMRKLPGGVPNPFVRQDIWIANAKSGKLRRITNGKPGKNSYWHPVWSPNSQNLAFYGDKDDRVVLWICRNATGKNPKVQAVEGITLKAALFRWDRPRWTKDGERLIIPVLPESEKDSKPGIDDNPLYLVPSLYKKFLDPERGSTANVIRSSEESGLTRFFTTENRVDLAILNAASGKMRKLISGLNVQRWDLSPDGQMLAFKVFKETIPGTSDMIFDLYVMSLEGGSTRLLLEDTEVGYNFYSSGILWSPDSTFLLERKKGELVTVNVKNREKKVITPGADSSFKKIFPGPTKLQRSIGIGTYIWSTEGDRVIAQNEEGWWLLSLEGASPKKLFTEIDVKVMRILRTSRCGNAFSLDGHSVILETFDKQNAKKDLYKADLRNNRIEQISKRIPNYLSIFELSPTGKILYSVPEENVDNLWFSDIEFSKPIKFTNLNPHLKRIPRGKKMLIEYRSIHGEQLKGALLLPPDFEEGKRYPLIAYVYAGFVVSTLDQSFPLAFNPVGSLPHLLSQCGYIVLRPSIPLSPMGQKGSPLKDIPESVLPAIDRVAEMGIADREKIGVIGQSFGGYTVNVLITQTDRFKAAVSMAGISDLISIYGEFRVDWRYTGEGSSFYRWAESGQGHMGCTPWEDRLQWIENSPVFYLNNVETPLLLLHGDLDSVSIQQAEEMFSGLKRLNKTVEFVRYFGDRHILKKPANIKDSWRRIIVWFDKYLRAH